MFTRAASRWASRSPAKLQKLCFSSTAAARADFTHAVIGGGVVGLAVAQRLAQRENTSTILVERNVGIGMETSSRNSEVIHAGIYYGTESLKGKLCIRGKELLYELCDQADIPYRRTGKWIVAQDEAQYKALEKIYATCQELGVPMRWVSEAEVQRDGEGVVARAGVLESPTTGIVDSHSLMLALLGRFEESEGILALNSPVVGIRPLGDAGSEGWEIDVKDAATSETSTITAETIVNSAGLGAVAIHNMITPPERHMEMFYAKGNYFSYSSSTPKVSRLIYPVPAPGAGGLGTHLTLDLGGRIRFGPDVEWVDSPDDLTANAKQLNLAIKDIQQYLPAVDGSCLAADYAGLRPKLARGGGGVEGKGFLDFIIRNEEGYKGWVNLLGIESPGLTSCLAISEKVDSLVYGS
ncbi:FAD dependent oxidoreductase [Dactylonectria estremocensis]|uniref:L-2-hydroxyglutarate dehydrogenase, mitochondrial n=1 Tax=Dactylonectria estremocensis TaxID=1079267 RepID=A0A9P9FB95_9HYPO|nr:FAD dependent oxidoreductase [Dactylonectria estremocensis]